jgi:putative N6-adenine-specific DNA methylase
MPQAAAAEFYLVTLPGFEALCAREVKAWLGEVPCAVVHGGVTVQLPLAIGLSLNLVLKIPTRILLRVAKFRCRDFPKLYNKIAAYKWEQWLDPTCELAVEAASSGSRLKIKKRIEETCAKAWRARQKGKAPDPKKKATLFVRFKDDECTLSLDSSGERLHKRGARTHIGEAPIRETIAAGLLEFVAASTADTREIEVVDMMAGSGTFLLEALTRDQATEARSFAFQAFKCAEIKAPPGPIRTAISHAIGFEADDKTLQAAKSNMAAVAKQVKLIRQDSFTASELPAVSRQRWVLTNPPYGERLKIEGSPHEFYAKLFQAAENVAKPDRACFILPAKAVKGRLELPRAWKVLEKLKFSNGGIPVIAFLFGRIDG